MALILAGAVQGCRCDERDTEPGAAARASSSVGAVSVALPKALPPLRAESWLIELPLEGFLSAAVSVPLGTTEPRPVLIALHGFADRPEWQCGTWRGITDSYPFVICPRGQALADSKPKTETYTFTDIESTARELRAALAALKARFGSYVAGGSAVLTGYSLGAEYAAFIVRQEPTFFSRVVFVEGGHSRWSASFASIFAKKGGQRILFVCTQAACVRPAENARSLTLRAGAEAVVLDAKVGEHVLDGRVAQVIKQQWKWVVAGDPNWQRRGGQ